jgi:hypothetical protein
VNQQHARKPFVAPQIKEEASLVDVTLISGGGPTRNRGFKKCKKGGLTRRINTFGRRH